MPEIPYKSYVICTSPRSGSTLLCKMLASTGKAGNPDSHFHAPSLCGWLAAYQLSKADFESDLDATKAVFKAALKAGAGDTGLFGLRLQAGSFDFLVRQLEALHPIAISDPERFKVAFGATLFIHLTRKNKLDQAISRILAVQTGLWHRSAGGSELERLSPSGTPIYEASLIAKHIAELTSLDIKWENWFRKENLNPIHVTYDALSDDPQGILATLLVKLGLDRDLAKGIRPPVAKLTNTTNRQWSERFLNEKLRQ